jgi:ABC-type multidrug transport system fused ATPase/permease subunit
MALLAGFYSAQQGDVLIDGKPVAQLGLRTVRDNLALVSQDVLLVNDTVTANIAFGVEPAAVDGNRALGSHSGRCRRLYQRAAVRLRHIGR